MNHPLTPSQIEFHKAAKERAARKLEAARRHRAPVVAIEPPRIVPEVKRRKRAKRVEKPVEFKLPEHFTTKAKRIVIQEGEYCAHSGCSTEIQQKRSIIEIAASVLRRFPGVTYEMILSPRRSLHVMLPRHIAWHTIAKERQDLSYPQMAKKMNRGCHTSVMHGVNKIQDMVEDGTLQSAIDQWHIDAANKPRNRK